MKCKCREPRVGFSGVVARIQLGTGGYVDVYEDDLFATQKRKAKQVTE
jgi:hypothetical protein